MIRLVQSSPVMMATVLLGSSQSLAVVNPFTEHFANDASNWHDPSGLAPATWISSGGPDGSSYVSTTFNFVNQTPGLPFPNNAVNLFRGQDEFNSSGGAFVGDWITAGVTELSFYIRHDGSQSLNFFARFSTPSNFPAWSGVEFTPIAPNTWTQITVPIALSNPGLFFEGPPGAGVTEFNAVFGNIGHVQIGAFGGTLAGVDETVTFDLDQVSIVPAPAAGALFATVFGLLTRGRRRPH
jgi:hypothetical protein